MKPDLFEHLLCPKTREPLKVLEVTKADGDEIIEGKLGNGRGSLSYGVTHGVPNLCEVASDHGDRVSTIDLFGSEWTMFERWGWMESFPDEPDADLRYWGGLIENSVRAFEGKALFQAGDLGPGKLILDAGCGNGRFSNVAERQTGATVFAVDASEAAYVAFANLRGRENVHVIRANVLDLPFRDNVFDAAFSIGVMQHTGNGRAFIGSLNRVVKPGKPFTINCYGKGLPTYEAIDWALRSVVARLPPAQQMRAAELFAAFDRFLRRGKRLRPALREALFRYINLLPTSIHMFDWYAPRIAAHYSVPELLAWTSEAGAEITHASPPINQPGYRDKGRRRQHAAFQFRALSS